MFNRFFKNSIKVLSVFLVTAFVVSNFYEYQEATIFSDSEKHSIEFELGFDNKDDNENSYDNFVLSSFFFFNSDVVKISHYFLFPDKISFPRYKKFSSRSPPYFS